MPLSRKKIDAVVFANPKPSDFPVDYQCGYAAPIVYAIDVGNPQGTEVIDVRFELVPPTRHLEVISLIQTDLLDASHITLACQENDDSTREKAPIRIFALISS